MHFHDLLFIAVSLAMDAFAVAVAMGATLRENFRAAQIGLVMLFFGGFQALMPLLGWCGGNLFERLADQYGPWIACILLVLLGGKMVYEAFKLDETEEAVADFRLGRLTVMAFATSIDALVVGVSFACLKVTIVLPIIVIGVVTAVISLAGCLIGKWFGHLFENKFEAAGGIILILLGLKILFFR